MAEEIIIDGVDVSECEKLYWDIAPFLKKEERPFNQHEWKCGGGFAQTYCHNDKNCLYKQLKRKEQECEELKKERDTLSITRNKLLDDLWVVEENLKDYMEHFNKASDELDQLKQTLTNIKEIAENVIKNVSDRCIETTPMYGVHKQILQVISEVVE